MNLLRAITTVGGFTMLSRVFGFIRDMLIAAFMGAGPVADAFFVAFKLPNLFRRLFAEGAFAAAFVPIFAGRLESDGAERAKLVAEQALSVLVVSAVLVTAVFEVAMPWVMRAVVPGFLDDPETFDLTVTLTRITFPYLVFISVVSLLSGVLNSLGKFAAAAATPVLLNICLIGALLTVTPYMPSPGHALAWGVSAAGVVQLVWLYVAAARAGVRLRFIAPVLSPDVRTLFNRALPVALGGGVYQVSLVIDTIIASLLPAGSISFLFYADRVNQLPLGVVGVAVGTALLPMLSRQLRAGDARAAANSQNRSIEFALLLTLPAAAALFIIAEPIIRVLFERGEFTPATTSATAAALAVYAIGLPAYVLVKALAPGFFAREDTKTPVVISCIALAVNLVLNLLLMGPFLHVGIAMATSASAWLNCLLLAVVLRRRGQLPLDTRLTTRLPRTAIAVAAMCLTLVVLQPHLADGLAAPALADRVFNLVVLVAAGLATFGVAAVVSGAARPSDLRAFLGPARSTGNS
ncbi:MAG: murein biosynthesis integral membrane protein MurJ [Rhodospirillales bacterium]